MRKSLILALAVTIFAVLGLAPSTIARQIAQPTPNVVHATFDTSELKKNLTTTKIALANEQSEKVTFKVFVNEHGNVDDLTFTHNIPAEKAKKADTYIQKAYKAIMATDFYPAKKDGKNISDVLTIEFVVVD